MLRRTNKGVPPHLSTQVLEVGARASSSPECHIMLLAVEAQHRSAMEAKTWRRMREYGESYTDALRTVVTRHIKAKHRKETPWTSSTSSTGHTLGSGGTGHLFGSQLSR